jgi:multiple sugar transport system ATP-binding protein
MPDNLFVAGFIGTPPMNLFRARLVRDGDYVAVELAGTKIPLPKDRAWRYPRLAEYAGREVVLGVRAEDVYAAELKRDWPAIKGRLGLLEALGSSQMGYLHIDATLVSTTANAQQAQATTTRPEDLHTETASSFVTNLVAFFPPRMPLKINTDVSVALDPANLHFFDADSGAALR